MSDSIALYTLKEVQRLFSSRDIPETIIPGVTKLSELVLSKGSLEVRYYEPGSQDMQVPHNQEELYFVIAGTAQLKYDKGHIPCGVGDVIFVPKKSPHKFVEISKDFAVWVVYFDA